MSIQNVLREARRLSVSDRHQLIKLLVDTLPTSQEPDTNKPKRSLLELEGLGADIWQGIDAHEYVNQLRAEWDHRA